MVTIILPFSIHDSKNNTAEFFVDYEGTAEKGSNEICSFLYQYINDKLSHRVTELYLFSDNCPGQNRDHVMIRFLLAFTDTGRFRKIVDRLPIRGHSYLAYDREFAIVKQTFKNYDRLYSMNEVVDLITQSTNKPQKFITREVKTNDAKEF